jgi:hypothetical protein
VTISVTRLEDRTAAAKILEKEYTLNDEIKFSNLINDNKFGMRI